MKFEQWVERGFTPEELNAERGRLWEAGFSEEEISEVIAPDPNPAPDPELMAAAKEAFNQFKSEKFVNQPPLVNSLAGIKQRQPSLWDAIEMGRQSSIVGMFSREALPDKLSQGQIDSMPTYKRLAMQGANLLADFPFYTAGFLLGGGPASPVTATGGSFALPAGLRQVLVDKYEKGEVQSVSDFMSRAGNAVWETTKGELTGMAMYGAGQASTALGFGARGKFTAEIAAMVGVGGALEGHIPEFHEFTDAALLLGTVKSAGYMAGKLRNIYAKTGKKPAEVYEEARQDPVLWQELQSEKKIPTEYEPLVEEPTRSKTAKPDPEMEAYEKDLRAEAKADVDSLPVFKTIQELTEAKGRGTKEQRQGVGLDIDAVREEFGAATVEQIRTKRPGLLKKNGRKPDEVAEEFGFESPDALINELSHGKTKTEIIDEYVEAGMREAETARGMFEQGESETADTLFHKFKPMGVNEYMEAKAGLEWKIKPDKSKPVKPEGEVKAEKAIKKSDVIKLLEKRINIPIRTGKLGSISKDVMGFFRVKPEVIRLRFANNISVGAHEIGHAIHKLVWKGDDRPLKSTLAVKKELEAIATDPGSKGSALSEGFAEFVSFYVARPKYAQESCPHFYRYFESEMIRKAPEVLKTLREARELVNQWAKQPAVMELLGHMSVNEKAPRRPITFENLYSKAIDELYPLAKIVEDMTPGQRKKGRFRFGREPVAGRLEAIKNPYKLTRLFKGWTGIANHFLERSPLDFASHKNVGKPLKDTLSKVENLDELRAYLVARRAKELRGRNIRTGIRDEAVNAVLKEYEPKFKDVAKELSEFQDAVLEYYKDAGMLSGDMVKAMREVNKNYVPFYRVVEESQQVGGAGAGKQARQATKKIKGSTRDIIDPLESIVKNTYLYINMAERNNIWLNLVKLSQQKEGMGKYIEKIPAPQKGTKVKGQEVEKGVKEMFRRYGLEKEFEAIPWQFTDDLLTVFRPDAYLDKTQQIAVWNKGKRSIYQVDPEIAKIAHGLDKDTTSLLVKLLNVPTRMLRAGATLNPDFAARNVIRDQVSASVVSKYGRLPFVDLPMGLFHSIGRTDLYWDWVKSGGTQSMFVSLERSSLRKNVADLNRSNKFWNVIADPLEALRIASEISETTGRLPEFARGVKKEGNTKAGRLEAAYASREIIDFGRTGGEGAKTYNKLSAFFNAALQGSDKLARSFKEKPLRTTLRGVAYITIPSVTLALYNNEHYQERWQNEPQWVKDLFWVVYTPEHTYRIPKPFEVGVVFGSIPERIIDYIYTKDLKAFDGTAGSIWRSAAPSFLPTGAVPILENWANRSTFREGPIVPYAKENLLPEYQYSTKTHELTKELSRLVGGLPLVGERLAFSPAKAENLVRGWTGGLGSYALDMTDKLARVAGVVPDPEKPTKQLAELPVIKAFMVRHPSASTKAIDRFYRNFEKVEKVKRSAKALAKEGKIEQAQELLDDNDMVKLTDYRNAINNIHKFIFKIHNLQDNELSSADRRSVARAAKELEVEHYAENPVTPDLKRELIDAAYLQMNQIAKHGNRFYEETIAEEGK